MVTQEVEWPQGVPAAFDLFAFAPELFCALLEHPKGEGRQFLVSRAGQSAALDRIEPEAGDVFFAEWRRELPQSEGSADALHTLFYLAYEAGGFFERLPAPKDKLDGPLIWRHRPEFSLCIDPANARLTLAAVDAATLDWLHGWLESARMSPSIPEWQPSNELRYEATDGADYCRSVAEVKELIAAGDIFQANIARFFSLSFSEGDLLPLYARLRRVNPAPFASFVRMEGAAGGLTLLSASPERLFSLTPAGMAQTRPIAGTRRRGEADDDDLRAELLLSEKERAEHIMMVDLERNDLGRVCRPGTVRVNECMVIERYATVQHIVSNVQGQLATGRDLLDLLRAMFPGGTITGCPKVRCMQIIHQMEERPRGPYTGGLGYIACDGSADMNILIRTFWHWQGQLHWAAGAGIVADSDPELELAETGHKAEGLLRALRQGNPP